MCALVHQLYEAVQSAPAVKGIRPSCSWTGLVDQFFRDGGPSTLKRAPNTPYYMVASLMFNSAEDLKGALKSPEMAGQKAS